MNLGGMVGALAARSAVRAEPGDYTQDGLLYCGGCKTPKQCRVLLDGAPIVVGCQCACAEAAYEARREAERKRETLLMAETLRVQGIADRELRRCAFGLAEETEELRKCRRYVENWDRMLKQNAGLLLWGTPGNGKTYAAACIANALIDRGVPALITSFPRILAAGWDKREIAEQMRRFPLLVLDDLGVERGSDYALETVYMVVDERYKSNLPLIVTTNLTLEDLRRPKDLKYQRIYERVLEMCVPVAFRGATRRSGKAAAKLRLAEEMLR